ncbi:MAG: acetamidase/formamidase family protein [Terriglobales bacterium]
MKWGTASTFVLAGIVAASLSAGAQQTSKSAKKTKAASAPAGKHYTLPATKENVQWGWLDVNEKPKLTINSGDTVSVETWYHALDAIKPAPTDHTIAGPDMAELGRLRKANPGGGPHSVTGPIYIEGAEPGDTLEVRILKIVPKEYGQNFNLPGKEFPTGLLPKEFPEGFVRYYKFDLAKMQTEFKPGIMVDLKPFPGVLAVAPDPNEPKEKAGPPIKDAKGRTSTLRPWKNGSNMDLNELRAGTTIFLPVFVKGALLWTGDSHCRQGNGEMNLEAIECAYKEIELQPIVHKDMKTDWPWVETPTHWIFMGFDEDLTEATKIAVNNTIDWLSSQKMVPMDRYEAYALTSIAVDCDITQMVDIRKGVHCMVPKSIFVKKSASASAAAPAVVAGK